MSEVKVGSAVLEELQTDLLNLSSTLNDIYEMMNADVSAVGEQWKDNKFDEFVEGYRPQIDKCGEISERYSQWAKAYLNPVIEHVKKLEGISVTPTGLETSSGGASAPSGGRKSRTSGF